MEAEKDEYPASSQRFRFTYHHLQSVNSVTHCLKNFEIREHPSPIRNGWKLENGKCRAVRYQIMIIIPVILAVQTVIVTLTRNIKSSQIVYKAQTPNKSVSEDIWQSKIIVKV